MENMLADAFRRSLLDPTATDTSHFHNVFNKRLLFLQKLLSAELTSHPEASDQLRKIEQRLAQLKVVFRDWSRQPTNTELIPRYDEVSVCSDCTQTLLCDEDVHECDDSPVAVEESFCGEKSLEMCTDCKYEEEESVTGVAAERRNGGGIWKYCRAFKFGQYLGYLHYGRSGAFKFGQCS